MTRFLPGSLAYVQPGGTWALVNNSADVYVYQYTIVIIIGNMYDADSPRSNFVFVLSQKGIVEINDDYLQVINETS